MKILCSRLIVTHFKRNMAQAQSSNLAFIDVKNPSDAFELFNEWHNEAKSSGINPDFMNLATCSKDGIVSNRTLVLRDILSNGLVICGNGNSRKFFEMRENPRVAATFLWMYTKDQKNITKQVRVEGAVEQLSFEETTKYYEKEPLYCKIRSHICDQGKRVDWDELKKRHDELLKEVTENKKPLSMPTFQVSYKILPASMDFYYAHDDFIADRILFTKTDQRWEYHRICT